MVAPDPKHAVIRKQVASVQFGFYTDEDVRARAVVEVTSPQAFDAMGTALPGGLYDPKFGPYDKFGTPVCITCACPYQTCPGHSGVVELCVPVYHPMLFHMVIKMMRAKCLACHRFRIDKMPMEIWKCKQYLLNNGGGNVQDVLELDQLLAQASKTRLGGGSSGPDTEALEALLAEKQEYGAVPAASSSQNSSTMQRELQRNLQKEFWGTCLGSKKCPHCGAFSPKIRQDESNKLFQSNLAMANQRVNDAEGIVLEPALKTNGNDGSNVVVGDDDNSSDDGSAAVSADDQKRDKFMHALEVEAQIRRTWEADPQICHYLLLGGNDTVKVTEGYRMFFMRAIPVPPSRFRPPMVMGGMTVENSQNQHLNKMLVNNDRIRTLMVEGTTGKEQADALSTWIDLQTTVNVHMDSSKDPRAAGNSQQNGIRQILEKKEGIFRKHMMGKRVDFCCRSVISPDPYVGTDEIGVPLHFAKTLTFPQPVSHRNLEAMRDLVRRGPNDYPGAVWVQFADGRRVDLAKMDEVKREGIASRLLTLLKRGGAPPIVGRQLINGDMMLVNRQPTLHKPGIMAHKTRVLYNADQKTLRMHYANCNTYNADFDGDEMNCHFPQNYLAAAESKYIAATDLQYIAPTDGSPLRGLIQDHVDAGVKLTCKNTFIEKWEYQQLIFNSLASLPGLEVIRLTQEIEMVPPAILKPKPLWTGKQVITTLLNHLRKGNDRDDVLGRMPDMPGISVEGKSKLSAAGFGESEQEHLVLIRDGELLRGILDKNAFGSSEFSMVHAVYEGYGAAKAGLLLNALGRLFTAYLQHYSGHSCRMEDLILTREADEGRRKLVQRAYAIGSRSAKAWADSEGGKVEVESVKDNEGSDIPLKPVEAAAAASKIGRLLSGNEGGTNFAALDGYMQSQLNPLASELIKTCLPNGLQVPFPENTFGLMVSTGAKGSMVNQSQVSCALGQQALEGRRVPRLASGRTLPSFAPYDPSPRADGFIMDRFLTGIRPQEYYFHCMAGREGLVDTAVKTSRSGYLQRCLVKHLEELMVCYDSTVRNGEGGVIQFLYGEDGLDPTKSSFLDCSKEAYHYMARNHESLARRNKALPDATISVAANDHLRYNGVVAGSDDLMQEGGFVIARRLRVGTKWVRGTLCRGWFDAKITKCNDDGTFDIKYIRDGKEVTNVPLEVNLGRCGGTRTNAASSTCTVLKAAAPDPVLSGSLREDGVHRLGSSGQCVSEKFASASMASFENDHKIKTAMKANGVTLDQMNKLVAAKYCAAICSPGEAVGSIAAQSIGEPSTQMTLNTFHLAGSGANVTLGIPRLREIIMTASKNLKTPTMSVPLHDSVSDKQALRLTRYFTKLTLGELIASRNGIVVNETLFQGDGGNWERAYHVTLKFHPAERIHEAFGLGLEDIAQVISSAFKPKIAEIMKRELRRSMQEGDVASFEVQGGFAADFVGSDGKQPFKKKKGLTHDDLEEEDDEDNDDAIGEEDGVTASRFGRQEDGEGYIDEEAQEVEEGDEESSDSEEESSDESPMEEFDDGALQAFTNMSDQPKLDRSNNAIHLPALRVDPAARPLLMVGLVERAAAAVLVRCRPKLDQGFVNDEDDDRGRCLQTAGVNFTEMWQLENVDHDRLTSNDIWAIRCAYGVEAARNNIVESIKGVFKPYGISVDQRHLTLIADYMTFEGDYKPMNRGGMADISSPFLQMSFETTANFMTEAALSGRKERMMSPSANIVLGRPIRHGTGAFDLLAA